MSTGDARDPRARNSTDDSLRSERRKTDVELASSAVAIRGVATDVVAEARQKADSVLNDARDREDLKLTDARSDQDVHDLNQERAREDAVLKFERSGADVVARDESERRQLALASLLADEREDTDLRLEIERKRADQALTSREDFMAMVSHDLRSLLGGIALSAEMLTQIESVEDPFTKVKSYAERIQRFSTRMSRLVGDLMDVASIEAGRLSLVRSRRDVTHLLRDSIDAFAPAAAARGILLTCECRASLGSLELDHERILQVLTNLVGNALKFTESGGTIAIKAERRVEDVCFAVTDTGEGIPADSLTNVFDRSFQIKQVDRRGLGLGLYIAKSIIAGHGGEIWAESTLGQGSTFFFTVPTGAPSDMQNLSSAPS